MTNASASALAKLAVAAKDVEQYGDLIDALYKIIYEGSGACKRLPPPPPEFAMEVKHLRTMLRHDVDHGDAAAASKKRKLAAKIFAKYSGKQTPGECGSDEFIAAQLRLLSSRRGGRHDKKTVLSYVTPTLLKNQMAMALADIVSHKGPCNLELLWRKPLPAHSCKCCGLKVESFRFRLGQNHMVSKRILIGGVNA